MKYLYIFLLFIFTSCGLFQNKMVKSHEQVFQSDTVIQVVDRFIEIPVETETIIQEPCDSNGLLKAFETSIQTDKGSVHIYSNDNKIHASIETEADTCKKEFVYKTNEVTVYKDKIVTKYKTPKWAWYSLIANVLFLSYLTRKLWL